MEYRTLDITLQSAMDLNKVNLITKMDVYAVVSISGGDKSRKQKTKTPVDHEGDASPTWDFPMKFTIDEAALQMNRLMLDIKLVCQRALGDKDVGEVNVPIKELLDSVSKGGAEGKEIVRYQVRKPSGKPKGQLNFSYQFGEKNHRRRRHGSALWFRDAVGATAREGGCRTGHGVPRRIQFGLSSTWRVRAAGCVPCSGGRWALSPASAVP